MQVIPYRTKRVMSRDSLEQILEESLPKDIPENSIVAVTSKIVSICEGRVVKMEDTTKDALIEQEAQFYLPREENPFNVSFAITHNVLAASAGVDESNGNGYYILWPEDAQKSANTIREFLTKRWGRKHLGVVITDSKTNPMRWGVTAIAIGYSGFKPLKNYINTPDIFGRPFAFEQMSIIDNVACAAALVMGEGAEQTPLAVVRDLPRDKAGVPFVEFQDRNPTPDEIASLRITMDEDLYGPFLKSASWKKGKK